MDFGPRFWVVAALSLGPAVATAFARFAYALILPAMRVGLGLSYSQAGALNTAIALGYLSGALIATRYVSRLGNRRLFCGGMVAVVLATVGSGLAGEFIAQLLLRAVAAIWAAQRIEEPSSGAQGGRWPIGRFRAALGSHFLFGVEYIAYMTGSVAILLGASAVALHRRECGAEPASSRRGARVPPPQSLGTAR